MYIHLSHCTCPVLTHLGALSEQREIMTLRMNFKLTLFTVSCSVDAEEVERGSEVEEEVKKVVEEVRGSGGGSGRKM